MTDRLNNNKHSYINFSPDEELWNHTLRYTAWILDNIGPMLSIVRNGNNLDGSPANIVQDLSQSGF